MLKECTVIFKSELTVVKWIVVYLHLYIRKVNLCKIKENTVKRIPVIKVNQVRSGGIVA